MDIINNKQQLLNKKKRLVSSAQPPQQGRPEPADSSSLIKDDSGPINSSFIRTMEKDMAALGKTGVQMQPEVKQKTAVSPPSGLPTLEMKKPKPVLSEIIQPEVKPEDKPEKPKKPTQPKPIQPEVKPEDKPEKPKKPSIFNNLFNSLKSKIAKLKAKKTIPPKPELLRPKASGVVLKDSQNRKKLVLGLMALAIILIIGGIGGFFYWFNYIRQAEMPITLTHFECQDEMCVSINGEGDNQCQIDTDCQTIEPIVTEPDSLITETKTKTVELIAGQENLLVSQLRDLSSQDQTKSAINRVLAKIADGEQKYLDLNELTSALNLTIPENISSAATGNHTLFLYSQEEGNRLGLVIEMGESETLVQDLNAWETTMADDLESMFLTDNVSSLNVIEFYDNTYNNTGIRYINLLGPGLTIDYALIKGNLVITTSKESMFSAIDAMLSMEDYPGSCGDLCGDTICQETVCQGDGCPCAESAELCPVDCVQ